MSKDDPAFSDRGSPAFLSPSEPAIKLLRERYSESFALTEGRENQIHLFLIKVGLWSLVWTFTPRDLSTDSVELSQVLSLIEKALLERSPFATRLDSSVEKARERIKRKVDEFNRSRWKIR